MNTAQPLNHSYTLHPTPLPSRIDFLASMVAPTSPKSQNCSSHNSLMIFRMIQPISSGMLIIAFKDPPFAFVQISPLPFDHLGKVMII